jgi:peptidoglycan/xylan/chitin deacetylase (PgdA/CDA1 family)
MLLKKERDKFYVFRQGLKQKWLTYKHGTCNVLLYHRVTNLELDPQLLAVSPQNFYEQVDFIKRNYHLLSIDEFDYIIEKRKKFPKHSFILTFDDGYADNLYEALPILECLNTQALFFIATATLGTKQEFWWDDLERIFLEYHQDFPTKIKLSIVGKSYDFLTNSYENIHKSYRQLHRIIKPLSIQDRTEAFAQILLQANLEKQGRISHRPLTWEELKKLASSSSVAIGCHTHNHVQLSAHSQDEQYQEISTSKQLLEQYLQKKIVHFSYPFGTRSDYGKETMQICKNLNLQYAYANYPEKVKIYSDVFQIPRFLVRNWGTQAFANYLSKLI